MTKKELNMSSDNCIAILITTDYFKIDNNIYFRCTDDKDIIAYRVAHIQGHRDFDFYREKEIHNLGWWMACNFNKGRVLYSKYEAVVAAQNLNNKIGYTEYGVVELNASSFNFPGC